MRLLLDESVPTRFRRSLPNHEVRTVVEMGWSGARNGELLALAASEFDAFVTVDKQRVKGARIELTNTTLHSTQTGMIKPLQPFDWDDSHLTASVKLEPPGAHHRSCRYLVRAG